MQRLCNESFPNMYVGPLCGHSSSPYTYNIRVVYDKALKWRLDTKKDTCHDEIRLCAQNQDTNLSSIAYTVIKTYATSLKKTIMLPSSNFSISTPIMNLEMVVCIIYDY